MVTYSSVAQMIRRISDLEAALKPLAIAADKFGDAPLGSSKVLIELKHLRKAREVLNKPFG